MKTIGIKKMAVIMWCALMITIVMVCHLYFDSPLKTTDIMGLGLIAGLGGYHSYRQGQSANMPEGKPANQGDKKTD